MPDPSTIKLVRARDIRGAFSRRRRKKHHSIADRSRDHIKQVIRGEKGIKWNKQLGCNRAFFIAWIESQFQPGMTWQNRGAAWHIDHKKPCAIFDLLDPEQRRQCNHWSNLQPMWTKKNQSKSDLLAPPRDRLAGAYVSSEPREHLSQRVGVSISGFWGNLKFTTTFGTWLDGSHQTLLDTLTLHPNRLAAVGIASAILEGVLETLCVACGFRKVKKYPPGITLMAVRLGRRGIYPASVEFQLVQLAVIRDMACIGWAPPPENVRRMAEGVRAFLDYCCTQAKPRALLSGSRLPRPRKKQTVNIYQHVAAIREKAESLLA
jgi:hypothetical protein